MKIVQIIPGSGGTFYCENCLRDTALIAALRRRGDDVIMAPMYLPLYTDDPDFADDSPVFFGGINVYLQEKIPFFRKTPRWLDKLFDARPLLAMAAAREGTTKASGLGRMTLSMLAGETGNQAKELDRLIGWLKEQEKPDIIHISSSLLLGMAGRIKAELGVPIVCNLQDEDTWLDEIEPAYREECWEAIRNKVPIVDMFVTVSAFYRDLMIERLRIPEDKIKVVHIGIETAGHEKSPLPDDPHVIGYLSKMSEALGLGTLVDAFLELKKQDRFRHLKLRAMGGKTGEDKAYVRSLEERIAKAGFQGDALFLEEVDRESRLQFLKSLTVMSVPMPRGEAFGVFMIEAMAVGVPVVQPAEGGFPEVIAETGGGAVYRPNTATALADALAELLGDGGRLRELGQKGRESVLAGFNTDTMADRMLEIYRGLTPEQ